MIFFIKDNFCTIYKLKIHQLKHFLELNGHINVDSPENAEIVISGVCAAFEADEARSISIMDQNRFRKVPHYAIGCMVTVNPEKIKADYKYRTWEFDKLAMDLSGEIIKGYDTQPLPTTFCSKNDYRVYDLQRHFVGITTGCGYDCSYCSHKIGAGDVKSRPIKEIISDVNNAIFEGAKIIHLTGLDTASYGKESGSSFPTLLKAILDDVGKETVFHIAQFNPEGLEETRLKEKREIDELINVLSDRRVVDFQLPIQTSSQRLLKLMNRHYDPETLYSFVKEVKTANPFLFLRTDLMVGFPSETIEELDDSICFVSDLFNEVAVYYYEHKHGTPIARDTDLKHINSIEKMKRLEKASNTLKDMGLLVHSGGQQISTLYDVDKAKSTKYEYKKQF